MKRLTNSISFALLGAFVIVAGCTQQSQTNGEMGQQDSMQTGHDMSAMQHATSTNYQKAVAVVHGLGENELSGVVTFTKVSDGVRVQAEVSGLEEGKHGFHIHQYGNCTAPDGSSAGGHYNPAGEDHGAPTDSVRHMGDMGNIQVDAEGNATIDYVDSVIKLNGPKSIIGRGLVLHGGEDDLTSQPSGAAGPRIGCGVIGIAGAGE